MDEVYEVDKADMAEEADEFFEGDGTGKIDVVDEDD